MRLRISVFCLAVLVLGCGVTGYNSYSDDPQVLVNIQQTDDLWEETGHGSRVVSDGQAIYACTDIENTSSLADTDIRLQIMAAVVNDHCESVVKTKDFKYKDTAGGNFASNKSSSRSGGVIRGMWVTTIYIPSGARSYTCGWSSGGQVDACIIKLH